MRRKKERRRRQHALEADANNGNFNPLPTLVALRRTTRHTGLSSFGLAPLFLPHGARWHTRSNESRNETRKHDSKKEDTRASCWTSSDEDWETLQARSLAWQEELRKTPAWPGRDLSLEELTRQHSAETSSSGESAFPRAGLLFRGKRP